MSSSAMPTGVDLDLHAEVARLSLALNQERERADLVCDFIENGSIGLHWVGADGTILWANQAELDLLGFERSEYVGRNIAEFHADAEVIADILTRLTRNETLNNREARLRCKNGAIRTVLINSNVLWRDGQFIHTRCFTRDITDIKLHHTALGESEARFRTLIEWANDAIFLADGETGVILDANGRAAELMGCAVSEICGRHQRELHPADKADEYAALFRDHLRAGGGLVRDVYVRNGAGEDIPVEISGSVIQLAGRPAILGIFRDVTERKRVESELAAAAAELARSNAELGLFAATASHDLQEPLRVISSYASLIGTRYAEALDQKARDWIKVIGDTAVRAQDLVKALHAYAQVGHGNVPMAAVSTMTVLREAVENLDARMQACHAAVSFDGLPVVTGDRVLLVQLFQNLIANAMKFCEKPEPQIRIEARKAGRVWTFAVADNGIGIASDQLERIFQPFQRAHGTGQFPGTGLGLATCQKIVELHRGRIWVESTLGVGSIFFVTLPA